MTIKSEFTIIPYDQRTRNGLYNLYYSVASQRTGIARLPEEITQEYIENIYSNTIEYGIGFSAVTTSNEIIGDIHAEIPQIKIFRNILWNLTIAIHPNYQNKGIGKLLFTSLINKAREKGNLNRIELFCKERNENGIKLYKKLGFEIEGILRNRTNLDGQPENDLVMALLLNNTTSSQQVDASEPATLLSSQRLVR